MKELAKQCLLLNKTKRERLVQILLESLERKEPTDESRFQTLYDAATEIFGNGILTGSRDYNLVLGRSFISYQMHNEGYSFPSIGRHLIRHHSSAIHLYRRMENILDYPEYYALEISYWKEFQERVKEKEMKNNQTKDSYEKEMAS